MSAGYRPAPYTVAPPRRPLAAAATATSRCGGSTGSCCWPCSGCASSAALLVCRRRGRRLLDAGADPNAFLKKHILNIAHRPGARRCGVAVRLPDAARVRAGRLRAVDRSGWSRCSRRWGRRSTARTRGSCCRPASRCSRRSSPRSRSCVGMAMLLAEKRDAEDEPARRRRRARARRSPPYRSR